MSATRQILRFLAPGSRAGPGRTAGDRVLLDIWLDANPAPIGHIVQQAPAGGQPPQWAYVLSDGRPSGLATRLSRQTLENMVSDYYFQRLLPPGCAGT